LPSWAKWLGGPLITTDMPPAKGPLQRRGQYW
jgi:hypothetical protein